MLHSPSLQVTSSRKALPWILLQHTNLAQTPAIREGQAKVYHTNHALDSVGQLLCNLEEVPALAGFWQEHSMAASSNGKERRKKRNNEAIETETTAARPFGGPSSTVSL